MGSQRTAGREGRSIKRGRRHFFLFSSCFYLGNPGRGPSFTVLYWAGQDFLRFARKMEHIRATSAEVKPVWISPNLTRFIRLQCFVVPAVRTCIHGFNEATPLRCQRYCQSACPASCRKSHCKTCPSQKRTIRLPCMEWYAW